VSPNDQREKLQSIELPGRMESSSRCISSGLVGDSEVYKTDLSKLYRKQSSFFNHGNKQINEENPGWDLIREQKSAEDFENLVKEGTCDILRVGKFGETVLHYALLFENEGIAAWLIRHAEHGRTLIKAEYGKKKEENKKLDNDQISDFYRGEGCLHLAVVNRSLKIAQMLLNSREEHKVEYETLELASSGGQQPKDTGYLLNKQRAVGPFFQGKEPNTVYLGDTALDFAVCSNQLDMVDLLMGYEAKDCTSHTTKSFNRKWRASLVLKDTLYSNTVFHLCALKGYTKMWLCLTRHLEEIFMAKEEKVENEIKLKVEKWVRSQVNGFGFTPLQLAAYANNEKMVEAILSATRIKIWKWGDKAFYAYTLNEIDNMDTEKTHGIPVLTIILSEGHFELMSLEVLWKLLKEKWTDFGHTWTRVLCIYQGLFILALTYLFFECYPDLEALEGDKQVKWGRQVINTTAQYACYYFVFFKVADDIISMVTEMAIIFFNNWSRQKSYDAVLGGISMNDMSKDASLSPRKRCWTSFRIMWSLYFETSLPHVPQVIQKARKKHCDHISVAGFFLYSRLFSNVAFCVAQLLVLKHTNSTARAIIYLMVPILLIEYLQLLLWLQTNKQVGRFIAAMVTILSKDVMGFMVVLIVIIFAFAACFIVLLERSKTRGWWAYLCWMMYELTVGTGEFFQEEIEAIVGVEEEETATLDVDKYRRTLILIMYALYLWLMVVVIMNLLIAVMSQTTEAMRAEMPFRERQLKLSSVSLVARKLRAHHKLLCFWRKCAAREESKDQQDDVNQNNSIVFLNQQDENTMSSNSGDSDKKEEDESRLLKCLSYPTGVKTYGGYRGDKLDIAVIQKLSPTLKKYYTQIHYFCALEKEQIKAEQVMKDDWTEIIHMMKKKYTLKKINADESPEEKKEATVESQKVHAAVEKEVQVSNIF